MTDAPVYVSKIAVEKVKGPLRRALMPAEKEPIWFGAHSEIAEHYRVDPERIEPHAATLDYLVAAAAGWLLGTFAGALAARGIKTGEGDLRADARGDIVNDKGVLRVARIHVEYILKTAPENRNTAEHVHGFHAEFCPMARTIRNCVEISTELTLTEA